MKKQIIIISLFILIISFPILSQTNNVFVDVNCIGNSLIWPAPLGIKENLGTITATNPPTWQAPQYGTVKVEWTFMGDGTTPRHFNIDQWDQVQNAGGSLGTEYVELESYWSADGATGEVEYRDVTTANSQQIPVVLDHVGCAASGKISLTITRLRATSFIKSNAGPIVFMFKISAVD